ARLTACSLCETDPYPRSRACSHPDLGCGNEPQSTCCCVSSPGVAPGSAAPRCDPQDGGQRSPVPDEASLDGVQTCTFTAAAPSSAPLSPVGIDPQPSRVHERLRLAGHYLHSTAFASLAKPLASSAVMPANRIAVFSVGTPPKLPITRLCPKT